MKVVLSVVGFVAALLCFGSGVAAAPSMVNDPCFEFELSQEVPESQVVPVGRSIALLPYGTRCGSYAFLGPSTSAFAAWLALVAVIFGLAVWLRHIPAVRGAGIAVCVVGVFGLIGHQFGDFTAAAMGTVILTPLLVFALDVHWRRNAVFSVALSAILPVAAVVAYSIPFLADMSAAGVACAALAGAVLSAVLRPGTLS